MRCPECNKRNSVAAKACGDCGYTFKQKPVAFQVKFFIGFVIALVLIWGIAMALAPQLNDPQIALTRTAKALLPGPKSQDEANRLTTDFNHAMQKFLEHFGNLPSHELAKKLQANLPSTLLESYVFDLPRGLKLVEVDTALRVTDYLVCITSGQTKVYPIFDLGVFDDAAIINDHSAPVLVLVGHIINQTSHQPRVKVFSLLAGDNLVDESATIVPAFYGNGNATFAPNRKDINFTLSLLTVGQAEHLFDLQQLPINNETVNYTLKWQIGRYALQTERSNGQLFPLYCLAKCLKDQNYLSHCQKMIGLDAKTAKQLHTLPKQEDPNLTIKVLSTSNKKPAGGKALFLLSNPHISLKAELEKGPQVWTITSLSINNHPTVVQTIAQEPIKAASPLDWFHLGPKHEEPAPAPAPTTTAQVTQSSTPTPPPAAAETEESSNTTENTSSNAKLINGSADNISLRSKPNVSSSILHQVKKGTLIQVISKENGWYKVQVDGKSGYMYAGLIDYKKPDAYTVATIQRSKKVFDANSHSLGTLQVGDRLVVLGGIHDNKYKVQLADGKIGYVDKDAIDVKVDAPPLMP